MKYFILPPLSVAVMAGLATPASAAPTSAECNKAATEFDAMLQAKPAGEGIGWVLYPDYPPFASMPSDKQWQLVVERLSNSMIVQRLIVSGDPKFRYTPSPEGEKADAKFFLMADALEQCVRPLALTAAPDVQVEVERFDREFPPDERATLRSKMRVRL